MTRATAEELKRALVWRCFTKQTGRVKCWYTDEVGRRRSEANATHIKAKVRYESQRPEVLLDDLEAHVRAIPGCVRAEQMIGPRHNQVVAIFAR